MKITGARQESFIAGPDRAVACILLYGPDRGLVRERAQRLGRGVVEQLDDPFRVIELSATDLKTDPARLADETLAMALGGGRRLVRVNDATDGLSKLFTELLDGVDFTNSALVIVEAAELAARSTLRALFEKRKNAAALACYGDDGANLRRVITETLATHHLQASPDAMTFLMENLGSDRGVTRSELEKLALYKGQPGEVTLDDAMACIGDSAATAMDDVAYAAGSGNQAGLDKALQRAFSEGLNAVAVLRAVARHFLRLHQAAGLVRGGKNADQAIKSLRPPVFYKQADTFRDQVRRWQPDRLASALEMLTEAEMDCKTTGLPAPAICGRTLMRIAQAARRA
ncbi:MAG TPA: DNA polymerase III subunit delta [Rhodospirillales bacterium]|nr:DNA polymerase III subunit delta [Rhodospirillales bacterium]